MSFGRKRLLQDTGFYRREGLMGRDGATLFAGRSDYTSNQSAVRGRPVREMRKGK